MYKVVMAEQGGFPPRAHMKGGLVNHLYCGVDIAKDTAVFCIAGNGGEPLNKAATFANTTRGFREALQWIKKSAKPFKPFDIHLAMEASSVYFLAMAKFFQAQEGFIVSVVNPAQVKAYGQARLVRTKTDGVDALLIARFAKAMNPRPWTPPAPHEEEMLGIVRHLEVLKEMCQAERGRLHALQAIGASTAEIQKAVKKHIKFLEDQMDDLNNRLKKLAKEHPDIEENIKLLCSIPGIGEITAYTLIVEIGNIGRFENVKQLVAYAGLAPAERQSGTSVRGKVMINKHGSKRLRKSLYMPAVVAARYNPAVSDLYQRLTASGKKPICAVVACMRKLLHIAYGVLKSRKRFEPQVCC